MSIISQIWDNFYMVSLEILTKKKQNTRRVCEGYVTLAYSELCHIQSPGIFKTRVRFRTLVYPKLLHIQNESHIQNPALFRTAGILRTLTNIYDGARRETAKSYNYFCKLLLFSYYQLFMSSSNLVPKQFFKKAKGNFHLIWFVNCTTIEVHLCNVVIFL